MQYLITIICFFENWKKNNFNESYCKFSANTLHFPSSRAQFLSYLYFVWMDLRLSRCMNIMTLYCRLRSILIVLTYFSTRPTFYSTRNPPAVSEKKSKSNFYFNSVTPRLKRNWNRLPLIMCSINTVGLFKSALENQVYSYSQFQWYPWL